MTFFLQKDNLKKSESPHVLEFLGESLDNLNVRDDIPASEKKKNNNDDPRVDAVISDDDEKAFYDFLSTGRHAEPAKNDADDFELTSEEEEQQFYDFISTGKHRKVDLNDADSAENEVTSNDITDAISGKRRFKRHVGGSDVNDFGKIDDYFAQKDSLLGGSSWDGHYIGDIWSVEQ